MLRFLQIHNLAVIEHVEIEFAPGFNVLTGETGSGKSMLVEAVGLLLGGRATSDMIRTGEETASVQAIFDTGAGKELIIRRELSVQGRSRAYMDSDLVNASVMHERTRGLVELHGQHEYRALLDPDSHLDVLDTYASLANQRAQVAEAFESVRAVRAELDAIRLDARERAAQIEFLAFQADEIARAALRPGEDEDLLATKKILANAERLGSLCSDAYTSLYDGDQAALTTLAQVWRKVGELAELEVRFRPHLETRDAIKSQLDDLAFLLRSYASALETSPGRLQEVEDRLALLERLKRKYGPALDDVRRTQADGQRRLAQLNGAEDREKELQASLSLASADYLRQATALSRLRLQSARRLGVELERELSDLAMEETRVEMRLGADEAEHAWTERGIDRGELFASPNPGEELRPLARIASGGELSRFMLALRTLSASGPPGSTLVFDEVDAGIGGRVADAVGRKLSRLGGTFQVLCITHLPQLAAYAPVHFHIDKRVDGRRTRTTVRRLDTDARVGEVARMIGGDVASGQVIAAAHVLLEQSRDAFIQSTEGKAKGERAKAKGRNRRTG